MGLGQTGDDQRADPHSQRLGGLADAHDQSTPAGVEPADDEPPAGRIAAGRGHAAQEQEDPHGDEGLH